MEQLNSINTSEQMVEFATKYAIGEIKLTRDEEDILLYKYQKILNSKNHKSGYFGESLFEERYLKMNNISYKSHPKYKNEKDSIIPDFETNNAIYEIKNYLHNSTGTANEKIAYTFLKYARFNFNKPVYIVLICKNEELCDIIYNDIDFLNMYKQKNIHLVNFSDLIKE